MKHFKTAFSWPAKFRHAIAGIWIGFTEQNSFYIHLPVAAIVLTLGFWISLDRLSFCLLLLCIGMVIGAELLNTAIEYLARAVTEETDENVRRALDTASGAVLFVSLIAASVGGLLIVSKIVSEW